MGGKKTRKGPLLQLEFWQTSSRSHCWQSHHRLCSQELGGVPAARDTALQGSQAQQCIFSVSNVTGEEKIIPKSFLVDSEIKPGPAHEAQQMSQEPAVNLKYTVMAKRSTAKCSVSPETFPLLGDSWLCRESCGSCTTSKTSEIQHSLLPSACCLLWHL